MTSAKEASQIEIRLAVPGDEKTIAHLLREAFEPFREQYSPGGYAETTSSASEIRERMNEGKIWIAYESGEPVGTVTALADEGGGVYVRSMAVTPYAWGRGVGQKLLSTLERDARDRGEKRLHLYTTFVLPGAQPLYEKNGFVVTRETAPEEWHDMGGVEMEKDLN